MIKIAIIEDEVDLIEVLKGHLDKFAEDNKIEYSVITHISASSFLDDYQCDYDLILMDINLPGLDGMSAVKKIREIDKKVMVIFVTSLAQYAVEGYSVNAFDFIIKPVTYYNFALKLKRALINFFNDENDTLVVKNKNSLAKIIIKDIKYIEVVDHKLIFHTDDGNFEMIDTLSKYKEILKNDTFAQCNQCYLVNLRHVKKVTKDSVYIGDEIIQMSRRKQKEFLSAFNKYLGIGGGVDA